MKNSYILLFFSTFSLFMTGCKKAERLDENALFPVPHVIKEYDDTRDLSKTTTFEYTGLLINKKTIVESGNIEIHRYSYSNLEKGFIDSIVILRNNHLQEVYKYHYSGNLIRHIKIFDTNHTLLEKQEFLSYHGKSPGKIKTTHFSSGSPVVNVLDLTYSGLNFTEMTGAGIFNGMPVNMRVSVTYDDKKSPFSYVETLEYPILAVNNPLKEITLISAPIGSFNFVKDYNYIYDSNHMPVRADHTLNGSRGHMKIEYLIK